MIGAHDANQMWEGTPYPDMIRDLPEIDIPLNGVRGWLLQGDRKQVVFFELQPIGEIPPHSHCNQWGIVIKGEMKLTVGDTTRIYGPGEWYYVPEGVIHSATFPTLVHLIDVFDDPARYKVKQRS